MEDIPPALGDYFSYSANVQSSTHEITSNSNNINNISNDNIINSSSMDDNQQLSGSSSSSNSSTVMQNKLLGYDFPPQVLKPTKIAVSKSTSPSQAPSILVGRHTPSSSNSSIATAVSLGGHSRKFRDSVSSISSDSTLVEFPYPFGRFSNNNEDIMSLQIKEEDSENDSSNEIPQPTAASSSSPVKHITVGGHRSTKSEILHLKSFDTPSNRRNRINAPNCSSKTPTSTTEMNFNLSNFSNDSTDTLSSNHSSHFHSSSQNSSATSSYSSSSQLRSPSLPLPMSQPCQSAMNLTFPQNSNNSINSNNYDCSSTSVKSQSSISLLGSSIPKFQLELKKMLSNTDGMPHRPSRFKDSRHILPQGCSMLSLDESFRYVENLRGIVGEDSLPNLLVIDVRPFHEYCKSHIMGAINLCLPSTLLKRATFTLPKCIQTLTTDEKTLLESYLKRNPEDLPTLIFYDAATNDSKEVSLAISYLSGKFVDSPSWNATTNVLKGGFQEFAKKYPSHLEAGVSSNIPQVMVVPNKENQNPDHPPTITISPATATTTFPTSNTATTSEKKPSKLRSPALGGLSHFSLPDTSHIPFFKSRHHEELLTAKPDSSLHLLTQVSTPDIKVLPSWLSSIFGQDLGASVLSKKFNSLQKVERDRLNVAISKGSSSLPVSSPETPCFSAGVELGRKNRYKDVFPYEHSRVKIQKYDSESQDLDLDASYINASYIHYDNCKLNYIATQGPLEETIGDFWKVIFDQKVPFIVSLTAQSENQIEKCAPYWVTGTYSSNGVFIQVEVVEEETEFKLNKDSLADTIIRRIKVKIGDYPVHETFQVQILSWPDYGAMFNLTDLISLVLLKRFVLEKAHAKSSPVLVHCSAGCGRTGCFCTVDTVIEMLLNGYIEDDCSTDLVYDVVDKFRMQRVGMVQNLRQFIMIYDCVLNFIKLQGCSDGLENKKFLDPAGCIGRFVGDCLCEVHKSSL